MSKKSQQCSGTGWVALLTLILILAAGLRFYRIDAQSLWYDEGNSARAAERSADSIIAGAMRDIHPPGYYLLLAGWQDLTGSSELALRSLSALAGVLTVAVVAAIGRRLFDQRTGLLAALLVAVNPFQVWYGQEARMYALLGLLSAASILLTAAVLSVPGRMVRGRFDLRRATLTAGWYVLVNVAGLYTHYTFPFVILAESLVFLVWWLARPRRLHGLAMWVGLQTVTLLLYAPWLPPAFRQVTTWPRVPAEAAGVEQIAGAMVYGLTAPLDMARGSLIPLFLLAIVGLFPPVEEEHRYLHFGERVGLIALWLLIPVAIPVAMGVVREPFLKFFVPSGLALCLLVARGVVTGFRISVPVPGASALVAWLTRAIVLILLIGALWPVYTALNNLYFNPAYARDNYRAIAQRIMAEAGLQAAVVLDAPNQYEVFTYYYPDGPGITPLPDAHTEQTLARLLDSYERIYAVFYGEAEQDPQGIVEQTLNSRAFIATSDWYGDVRLVTYVVPAEAATGIETSSGAQFGDSITLVGYTLSSTQLVPGDALAVTLFWQANVPVVERYKVFVHLYGPDGLIAAQHDSEPGGDLRPTTTWVSGETVIDNHGLLLPISAVPGTYQLMVGLYGFDTIRLPISINGESVGDRLLLGEITVAP